METDKIDQGLFASYSSQVISLLIKQLLRSFNMFRERKTCAMNAKVAKHRNFPIIWLNHERYDIQCVAVQIYISSEPP